MILQNYRFHNFATTKITMSVRNRLAPNTIEGKTVFSVHSMNSVEVESVGHSVMSATVEESIVPEVVHSIADKSFLFPDVA